MALIQDFVPHLKDHILGRLFNRPYDGDENPFTDEQRRHLTFLNNQIYRHKVLRTNYTSYDLRRCQDLFNPRTQADFMTFFHEDDSQDQEEPFPYWFGRILGIFHAKVNYVGLDLPMIQEESVDFLFVRWYGRDETGGWRSKKLHRIGFVPGNDLSAFGFLDPKEIIHAIHLIPAFQYKK